MSNHQKIFMKFVSGRFTKIYQNILILVKIGQQQWTLYIKSSWEELAMCLSNQEIFQTKVAEKNEKMPNSLFMCVLQFSR